MIPTETLTSTTNTTSTNVPRTLNLLDTIATASFPTGTVYTLTTIDGVLDLSSPMNCPAEPHPTANTQNNTNNVDINVTQNCSQPLVITSDNLITYAQDLNLLSSDGTPFVTAVESEQPSSTSSFTVSSVNARTSQQQSKASEADHDSHLLSPTPSTASSVLSLDGDEGPIDPSLAKAALDATQTGSLTPIIKEELRYTIQNKRLLNGKGELVIQPRPPSVSELTPEEVEKRQRRRERNKLAAQKCRNKRKDKMSCLEKETHRLETHNKELRKQMKTLELEKQKLTLLLKCHDVNNEKCPMGKKLSTSEDDKYLANAENMAVMCDSASSSSKMEEFQYGSDETDSGDDSIIDIDGDDVEMMDVMVVDGEVVIHNQ